IKKFTLLFTRLLVAKPCVPPSIGGGAHFIVFLRRQADGGRLYRFSPRANRLFRFVEKLLKDQ
ncbi:MAG: hypothetical protein K2M42_10995, partial [Oscillospiraceae bacterium]|nr:hypothetical protein [Oscillospiraceae bacterium]